MIDEFVIFQEVRMYVAHRASHARIHFLFHSHINSQLLFMSSMALQFTRCYKSGFTFATRVRPGGFRDVSFDVVLAQFLGIEKIQLTLITSERLWRFRWMEEFQVQLKI
jgi:hypothetical protein